MLHTMEHIASTDMQTCIENCTNCHNVCSQTLAYCIQMGGKHLDAGHLESLIDCVDTCRISADFMLRSSSLHASVCGVCAEACTRCAESCAAFNDDDQMQTCAAECRRCAESCNDMANRIKM